MIQLYPVMRISIGDDEQYVWNRNEMLGSEWMMIQNELGGMKWEQWLDAIDDRDFPACQVLVWYLRRKNGRHEDRLSIDFPLFSLRILPSENEAEPDPEAPKGTGDSSVPASPESTESGPGNGDGSPALTSVA